MIVGVTTSSPELTRSEESCFISRKVTEPSITKFSQREKRKVAPHTTCIVKLSCVSRKPFSKYYGITVAPPMRINCKIPFRTIIKDPRKTKVENQKEKGEYIRE